MGTKQSWTMGLAWLLSTLIASGWVAAEDFYVLGETGGTISLFQVDPDHPASTSVIGPTGVTDLYWMEYDPRNDWFLVACTLQQKIYHLDRQTGAATALPGTATCNRMQGMAYVPPLGEVLIAYSLTATTDRLIGVVNSDGSITQRFDLTEAGVGDLDEILWDPTRQALYGISSQQQKHFTIDIYDGSVTTFTFDEGHPIFGSVNPDNGLMYEVPRRTSPAGGSPDLSTRNPETAEWLESKGTILGVDTVRGLSFVPEPSTAILLGLSAVLALRRQRMR